MNVAISAIGTIGAAGAGRAALERALGGGSVPRSRIEHPLARRGAGLAALVDPATLTALLAPESARRMSPPSRFAVAATKLALSEAKLERELLPASMAVAMATGFGPTSFSEKLVRSMLDEGPEAGSPALFTECVANAAAAQMAIYCRARGPNLTITDRECGAIDALLGARTEIERGRAPLALAGAVEEMAPVLFAALERFKVVTRRAPLPFGAGRDGYLAAEGATVLVLEPEASARDRGVEPLARIVAGGRAFDPTATAWGWGSEPHEIAAAVARSIDVREISSVVAGSSGSPAGDRYEALVLDRLFDGNAPPIAAPKGFVGECGGAALAAAVVASRGVPIGVPPGYHPDPSLAIRLTGIGTQRAGRVLATSFAAGGGASWVVLEGT